MPSPAATGPIKATVPLGDASHDYPYSATVDALSTYGYVDEGFFLEGTANPYTAPQGATGAIAPPIETSSVGPHTDFDAATSLYLTHNAYVSAVKDVTVKNLKAGYILEADAKATIATAEKSKTVG